MSAIECPVGLDTQRLREEIMQMYGRVATAPGGEFHFHRGPAYAVEFLGYDRAELDALPSSATESFAGISNPHAIAAVQPGEVVLDIGSGAGTDLLIAARRVGPTGKAIGVDMTPEMIAKCRDAAKEAGLTNVEVREGDLHALPVEDSSIDVVISNGVLNLAYDKLTAFREIFRVLKPGGRLQLGDIVVAAELSEGIRRNVDLWAA